MGFPLTVCRDFSIFGMVSLEFRVRFRFCFSVHFWYLKTSTAKTLQIVLSVSLSLALWLCESVGAFSFDSLYRFFNFLDGVFGISGSRSFLYRALRVFPAVTRLAVYRRRPFLLPF